MSTHNKRAAGEQLMRKLLGSLPPQGTFPADFMDLTIEHLFGTLWQRDGLELTERSMLTIAVLAALGREAELAVHVRGALNLDIPRTKLEEIMIHVAHYAGWPAGVSGLRVIKDTAAKVANAGKASE